MKTFKNIRYSDIGHERQVLDLYIPDGGSEFPVFVYFHGGGLESGSKDELLFIEDIVNRKIAVACANYRLYPTAVFPDFIRDAAAATAYVLKNISKYLKPSSFFIGGSSAGGYITQMLCFDKKYLAAYGIDSDSISGYFMDAGQPTAHFNVLRERGLDTRKIVVDESAPLYFIEEGRNYAPMQITVSDNDMENRYEQTNLLVGTLRHFGCDMSKVIYKCVENSTHCSYLNSKEPDGTYTFANMIVSFINRFR